jgi:hypothetical protein
LPPQLEDALAAIHNTIEEIDNAEAKDAVLRTGLALNVPAYRSRFSVDPKAS